MPQISIDIATAGQVTKVIDSFAGVCRYDIAKQPGETKAQFAKRQVAEFVRNVVRQWAAQQAVEAARVAALAAAEADAAGIS